MSGVVEWLLRGDPWVEYRTRLDLLGQMESDGEVSDARERMLAHPAIKAMITSFSNWESEVVSNHKGAGLLIHKLAFLADIGMKTGDPGMKALVDKVLEHKDESGIIKVIVNVPVHFGGTGRNEWGWALCDTPSVFYSLVKMGMLNEPAIIDGVRSLTALAMHKGDKGSNSGNASNGWPCAVSAELGKFRGPGKKEDPCPYATLLMVRLLSQMTEFRDSDECRKGAGCLMELWNASREKHPYLFHMGTDFRKLKAPFVWYDILHVADVLSQLEWLKDDQGLHEMADIISGRTDSEGRYTPQSEWKAWNGWEFGQKKQPSQWLTFLALRILKRLGRQTY